MAWKVELSERAQKELGKLDRTEAQRILAFLHERVAKRQPRDIGQAMKGTRFSNLWRYRVGNYRIMAMLEEERLVVLVVRIGHRKEVYR